MANLCAKLKQREKNKYRKIVSTDEPVYSIEDITINTSTPYVLVLLWKKANGSLSKMHQVKNIK